MILSFVLSEPDMQYDVANECLIVNVPIIVCVFVMSATGVVVLFVLSFMILSISLMYVHALWCVCGACGAIPCTRGAC